MKFRKKPVVIEAHNFDGTPESSRLIVTWSDGQCKAVSENEMHIETLEGSMVASKGDWIIKGIKGEFYHCKPDVFEATYEPAR